MHLSDYLKENKETQAAFAQRVGVPAQTLGRYINRIRIPKPEILKRITAATNGQVTANDFYDLTQIQRKNRAINKN